MEKDMNEGLFNEGTLVNKKDIVKFLKCVYEQLDDKIKDMKEWANSSFTSRKRNKRLAYVNTVMIARDMGQKQIGKNNENAVSAFNKAVDIMKAAGYKDTMFYDEETYKRFKEYKKHNETVKEESQSMFNY